MSSFYTNPPATRGRPKKHQTALDTQEAKRISSRRAYERRRQLSGPANIIALTPGLLGDVPSETPPNIGLRISPDIRIPQVINEDEAYELPANQVDHEELQTLNATPITESSAETTAQIEQVKTTEREQAKEQDEREAAIQQQIEETRRQEVLLESGRCSDTEEEGSDNTLTDTPARVGTVSLCGDLGNSGSQGLTEPQLERGEITPPHQDHQSPSNASHSIPKSFFPIQANNLRSWVRLAARPQPTSNSSTTEPIVGGSLRNTPSTPRPSIPPVVEPRRVSREPTQVPTQSPSPEPSERTAFKLAKQLRRFQGCTHEQHHNADTLHQEHHERADVHSACSSLPQITAVLRGGYHGSTPVPDVLSNPKLMKPTDVRGIDCKSIFEGTSATAFPEEAGTSDEGLPRSLCLSQHHIQSQKSRAAQTTFDVDSICCFPSSLGVAQQGIQWFPKPHAFLNLSGDIHFALEVPAYNTRGEIVERHVPLHMIPHYCFGTVIGMESLLILIFFPALRLESQYSQTTYLSSNDQELWLDAVLIPALTQVVGSSNIVQHYPASAHVAGLDATALSAETLARKQSAREQLLKYALQPQYLDPLWECLLERIAENPGLARFAGATLFMHAKNTKLEYMSESLPAARDRFEQCWNRVADPQFYSRQRTFVDIAKQVTSEDSALPYNQVPENHEAEVFLWKRCCLDAYARSRQVLLADGNQAKGNPRRTDYPWATMRDTAGLTLFASSKGRESADGLIYSQCYGLIKTPFDTSKTYVFNNEAMENLALDPGYVRSLQQEGRASTFSKAACEFGYLHSKKRANANLRDNRWKSYGIREEHRISLTLMDAVCEQWCEWDLYDNAIDDADSPLPYYIVPTGDLLDFLSAQINKYCFLFEHTLAHVASVYSLPETIVMVVALRALRFCYGSNLLQRESLLFKDRWEKTRGQQVVVKEGLGFGESMKRCGLGWFLPKFNWATRRLAPPHGDNMLVGNLLMHAEYKRRWRAIKDLRDVYVRFHQAEGWYTQYSINENPQRVQKWLEYLHVLNLQQFDADVWKVVLEAHKRNEELSLGGLQQGGQVNYCYHGMKKLFLIDGSVGPPHIVTGNKMRFPTVAKLLKFLFLWHDNEERLGWADKPYRTILKNSFALVERLQGYRAADNWLDEFLQLAQLTHWILPYPSNTALVASTKTSRAQGLQRRTMWFSAVYLRHETGMADTNPYTLFHILHGAEQDTFGERQGGARQWGTTELIRAFTRRGEQLYGQEQSDTLWVAGKRSIGTKGFAPMWERSRPPRLAMLELIRDKSLEELDEIAVGWTRDYRAELTPVPGRQRVVRPTIGEIFAQTAARVLGEGSADDSGSRYIPSQSSGS